MYVKTPTYKLCNSILKHLLRSTADSLYKTKLNFVTAAFLRKFKQLQLKI